MNSKPLVSRPRSIAACMDESSPLSRRWFNGVLAATIALFGSRQAHALCATAKEEGRWRNLDSDDQPTFIDVRLASCGDQVLNGQQTSTTYKMKVWVKQSPGKFYGRPWVSASYRHWNNRQWLVGKVNTGGYMDHVWMDAVTRNGIPHLRVIIKHESLDSKPSSQSEHWFSRVNNS